MASCAVTSSKPVSPRPRRKTAKAAAETISKALDNTEDDSGEEEYKPSSTKSLVPSSPKYRRPTSTNKRRSTSTITCSGKKCALSPETTEYLKNWMLSPDHIDHPYPTEEEKSQIMRHCGIEMKQLTNWFVNNRKRIWKPKLEELKKRKERGVIGSNARVASKEEVEREVKKKKTGVICPKVSKTHSGVKAANKKRLKINSSALVNNPLDRFSPSIDGDSSVSTETMPPLPPPQDGVATVTPLVDPIMISSYAEDVIGSAPLLPMTSLGSHSMEMLPHSCNLVDPVTNKVNRNAQACALCSACRDWNAGEFCPWDLTGLIGDISSDDTTATDELTDTTVGIMKEDGSSESIVSAESEDKVANTERDGTTTFTDDAVEILSSEYEKDGVTGISSFPSTASFPVPQEGRHADLSDIVDVDWD